MMLAACARADTQSALSSVTPASALRATLSATQITGTPVTPATPAAVAPQPTAAASATEHPPDEQTLRLPDNARLGKGAPLSAGAPTAIIAPETLAAPRLIIPKLDLDREIVKVPAVHGVWDLAHLGRKVGWLETTGQSPDDRLAMVLAGHLTVTAANMGPFANLWKLHVNDEVIYEAGDTDYVYRVKYSVDVDPSETGRLYVEDKHQLLLVTCSEWDYGLWQYGKRLIVVAEETLRRAAP